MNTTIFITYDSIFNSVFDSQVIKPLEKRAHKEKIIIISFEKTHPTQEHVKKKIPHNFTFFCLKKFPFIGTISLIPAILQLKKILRSFDSYSLIARGPMAGYITAKALNNATISLTIQARGLLAEEYAYTHQHDAGIKKIMHMIRFYQYKALEKTVYGTLAKKYHIEAVSNALKEMLTTQYHADQSIISIAQNDIPHHYSQEHIKQWRQEIRSALSIPDNKKVYCYSGSLHPWQCPEETIKFFKEELKKNSQCFLLVLTHDVIKFNHYLQKATLHSMHYCVMNVEYNKIYHYLAAADCGLIFREQHIINWVSRPTKILEYQAVGLPIIHNNTIAFLKENAG